MKSKARKLFVSALLALPVAGNAAIVQNGSFENPLDTWSNSGFNYMAVATGSNAITGWDVTNATGRGVAWGKSPTGDGFFPSTGSYFVDLSGFGNEAGLNAALVQQLQNLIIGETYTVGIDYWGDPTKISIDGNDIVTAGGGSSGWTHLSSNFVATGSQAFLAVGRAGATGIAFVDNLTVTGREASNGNGTVPEPGSLALALAALGALGVKRRRCWTRAKD